MFDNFDDDEGREDSVQLLSTYPSNEFPSNDIQSSPRNNRPSTLKFYFASPRLMKFLGNVLAVTTTILILVGVPTIAIYAMIYQKARPDFAALSSAGAFVVITIVISTKLIYNHLENWYMPDVQKYVVRILWMVPLYAVQSWLSMCFHDARIYIDTLRDLYEAYVIQSFLYYLVELLGGDDAIVAALQEKDEFYGHHHPEILNRVLPKWEMGLDFMLKCKYGVLQYVVSKALASIATACLEPFGFFNAGEISFTNAYAYIAFVINLSQMWALYCLVRFYHALHENLREPVNWRPLGKFLCIKLVVFFTWWQGVALAVLKHQGIIADMGQWDADDIANVLQDYLVCVEMFCFAIAHSFTFTHLGKNFRFRSHVNLLISQSLLAT